MALVSQLSHETLPQPVNTAFVVRLANKLKEKYGALLREKYPSDSDDALVSKSIAAFTISHFAKVNEQTAVECVCDGSLDGGIDALYVSNTNKILVAVQAKYSKDGKSTWKEDDFNKFQKACGYLLDFEFDKLSPLLNPIKDKIELALSVSDYKIYFVMAHTGHSGGSEIVLNQMKAWQKHLDNYGVSTTGDSYFQVHLFARDDISQSLANNIDQTNINLNDVKIYSYGCMEEPYRSYFGYIDGAQIKEWYQKHDRFLFNENIRGFLGGTNVNLAIQKSINEDKELFWYLNNGITILAKDISPHPRNAGSDKTGLFTLKGISIVNGAQTVSSIARSDDDADLEKVKVAVKVIKVESDRLAEQITKATNHQNSVSGRDFASQDPFQQALATQIAIEGYRYNLLRTDQTIPKSEKNFDIDEALDAIVCYRGNPSDLGKLKNGRGKFYDEINSSSYRAIFNTEVTGAMLINLVKINRYVERIKDERMHWYPKTTKEHKIVVHSYRAISHLVIKKYLKEHHVDIKRHLIEVSRADILPYYEHYLARIIAYMELLDGIHMPRFFENVTKLTDLFNAIREEEGDTLLAGGSLSLYNTSISRKDLESLSFL